MSVSLEEALAIAAGAAPVQRHVGLPLDDCLGRILAEDLVTRMPLPPFARSPLDGYALRAEDSQGAGPEAPVCLQVTEKLFAGMAPSAPLAPGCAVRVMTGAMLPPGADCVLRQEDTDGGETQVQVFRPLAPLENYVPAGEEAPAGARLLSAGTRLSSGALALAAAAGADILQVKARPAAVVLSTGDELTPPGTPLAPGRIYNSNETYLAARLQELGAEIPASRTVGDEVPALCAAIRAAAEQGDMIVVSGGVSVGQRDLLPEALRRLGAETLFQGVAMKPGMPTMLARLSGRPVLCLSGNPFAAAVGLELFGRALLGQTLRRGRARLAVPFPKSSPGRRLLRGRLEAGGLELPQGQRNGGLSGFLECNCLADIPAGTPPLEAGTEVEVLFYA